MIVYIGYMNIVDFMAGLEPHGSSIFCNVDELFKKFPDAPGIVKVEFESEKELPNFEIKK